ncbi:DUF202 domain-containing protein [Microlunatus flavus]|uniref:DUF202 domain-containing protein n=1 Tax=Microlunatus flavus TaxID=1036181 RepID=A0A1H9NKK6_9ACTN|nr:DUF202 domain-containing protein [Microlunatus flavus]SER36534.1 protein of unknown function [Microlunatus flavus]
MADEGPPPWDTGLQNERTGLAWQRTMLSGLACGLLVTRLLAELSLALAIVTGTLALAATVAFGAVALRRFRLNGEALLAGRALGDGVPPALAALLLGLTGLGALGYVLLA